MATGVERLENKKRAAMNVIFQNLQKGLPSMGSAAAPANLGHAIKVLEGLWEHDGQVLRDTQERNQRYVHCFCEFPRFQVFTQRPSDRQM
jgi:hypothetical protein